ncbi:phosphoribosylaminoimidazolesuccinocarboxamide synthase [Vaginisenegalia massiliensis]|uniref:phosphoribosylaminoimidazolesuccinocarboxamide synthase n=1 Tax=Vaginisenegalia massiliensis TaxID=2058294 RepID=UPI000F5405B9|nr:phosphoribosylaminoimidazolesuccinocarboxamide synthase [Vaginisenegalia massiliensis]
MEKLYEGKAKALYATDQANEILVVYSNQATALNGKKKSQIAGKGALNNEITSLIFAYLNEKGIPTQFIRQVDEVSQVVKALKMVPVEVVVRNRLAGSLAKKFDQAEGSPLKHPTVEYYYKNDELNDPFVNASQLSALGILELETSDELEAFALKINQALIELFDAIDLDLIDMKFEFGWDSEGQLILGDEISPDTCRIWDKASQQKMDKDNFRHDLGDIIPVYQEVAQRLRSYLTK